MAKLSVLAAAVGEALRCRTGDSISVFEASTGGMINAALVGVEGASAYYTGGASVYSARGSKLYPKNVIAASGMFNRGNYSCRAAYVKSKEIYALEVARGMREYMGTTWCLVESGAAGPRVLRFNPSTSPET